jgi:hypothetical protein
VLIAFFALIRRLEWDVELSPTDSLISVTDDAFNLSPLTPSLSYDDSTKRVHVLYHNTFFFVTLHGQIEWRFDSSTAPELQSFISKGFYYLTSATY